jgi:hypothetical protein
VYSHATALALRDLADANPSKLDMTVPPRFRKSAAIPSVLALHKARLSPGEIGRERGYAVTCVLRAIVDCARSGAIERGPLEQALTEGLARGLVTRREIREARKNRTLPDWLAALLKESAAWKPTPRRPRSAARLKTGLFPCQKPAEWICNG